MARRSIWSRWLGWLFGRRPAGPVSRPDTLSRRLDSAVRGGKERELLRTAEESLRRGRREEALRAYRAALEVFTERGAYHKSVAVLGTLARLLPNDPEIFEELANAQAQIGRRSEASASRGHAADLLDRCGRTIHAQELRSLSEKVQPEPESLHVHRVPLAPSVSPPAPSVDPDPPAPHTPPRMTPLPPGPPEETDSIDLGTFDDGFDDLDELRTDSGGDDAETWAGEDRTVAMPALETRVVDRPTLSEAPVSADGFLTEGLGISAGPSSPRSGARHAGPTDWKEDTPERGQAWATSTRGVPAPGFDPYGSDEGALSEDPTVALYGLDPTSSAAEEDEDDAADETLWDASFLDLHKNDFPVIEPSVETTRAPPPDSRPRGLMIPSARTLIDDTVPPHGSVPTPSIRDLEPRPSPSGRPPKNPRGPRSS